MRLYNQVLDDSEALDKKISKAVAKRADDSFCHPKDYWWKGLPRTIDVSNLFNIYNVLTDATKENTYNLQDPIYW